MELPLVRNVLEAPPCSDPDNLVVKRVARVEQVLKDLIHNRLLLLGDLDSNPLRNDNGDPAADDVETRLLLGHFSNQGLVEKGIKVQLVVQYVRSETDGCVDGVFEKDILVLRGCDRQYVSSKRCSETHWQQSRRLGAAAGRSNL